MMDDIYHSLYNLGLVSDKEEFLSLIPDDNLHDLEIFMMAHIIAMEVKEAVYGDPVDILRDHLQAIRSAKL